MRGPITWQSLAAPDLRGVALMMNQAQNSINSGFGNLTDVLKQREATETANWNQQKTNNTNELFNKLAGYKTPEEYQAAIDSGALQQEAAGYGAQVDQAAFRQALDRRMGDLQQRAVQGQQYADQQMDVQSRPIVNQLSTMALSDDVDVRKSAKEALGIYANRGLLNKPAELAAKIDAADNTFTVRDRAAKQFGFDEAKAQRDADKAPIELDNLKSTGEYHRAQAARLNAEAEADKDAATGKSIKRLTFEKDQLTTIFNSAKANNPYAGGSLGTPGGDKLFLDSLDKKMDATDRSDIGSALARVQKKLGIPVPVSIAQEAVFFSKNGWIENRGEEVEKRILEKMQPNIETYSKSYKDLDELTNNYQRSIAELSAPTPSGAALTTASKGTMPVAAEGTPPAADTTSKPTPRDTGSWGISKAPPSPYAGVGPDATPLASLPFGNSIVAGASSVGKVLDVLRGGENFKAVGKPFDSYEERIRNRLASANKEAAAKAVKGKPPVDNSDDEEDTRVNPNINNPEWLAAQRKAAIAKNAKLPESVKKRLGIE